MFRDREDAARLLAERLSPYRASNPLVLGVPRGGVPMAKIIAEALHGELDVVLAHKLRAPFQPEYAVGAVDEAGHVMLTEAGRELDREEIERETHVQLELLRSRRKLYTPDREPISPEGRITILVDDGIATGSTFIAALRAVRARRPKRLIAATAVAPPDSLKRVRPECDEVVCLHSTAAFAAVGQFFQDFSPVSDEDVVEALTASAVSRAKTA